MKSSIKNLLLGTITLAQYVQADQPVHCLREEMYGLWEFDISSESQDVNLFKAQEVCTHKLPNRIQFINKDYKF